MSFRLVVLVIVVVTPRQRVNMYRKRMKKRGRKERRNERQNRTGPQEKEESNRMKNIIRNERTK